MSVGPLAASDRPATRATRVSTPRLALLIVAFLALLGPQPALADDLLRTPGAKNQYKNIVAAWVKRDAAGLVAYVPKQGRLTLQLLNPPAAGTFQRAQAQRTLQKYFRGVDAVALKDVTKPNRRSPKNYLTRVYEYTYRPRGHDPVKTHLLIMMKGDGRGNWTLHSISESQRR